MLDRVHSLMLRGVAAGIPDGAPPAPALRALIEAGFVEEQPGRVYLPTERGRELLAFDD